MSESGASTDPFEIESSVEFILKHGFQRIALQFPDELLPQSSAIVESLKTRLQEKAKLFILGDTSYGSCCVDEVAAEHLKADLILHYGHSCLSRPSRIPVKFIFGKKEINLGIFFSKLSEAAEKFSGTNVLVFFELHYDYKWEELEKGFAQLSEATKLKFTLTKVDKYYLLSSPSPSPSSPSTCSPPPSTSDCSNTNPSCCNAKSNSSSSSPSSSSSSSSCCNLAQNDNNSTTTTTTTTSTTITTTATIPTTTKFFGRSLPADLSAKIEKQREGKQEEKGEKEEKFSVLFIGSESGTTLNNLIFYFNHCKVFSYDVSEERIREEGISVNKTLMRRFVLVEKAKDAEAIGILVGTLGVADYLTIINKMKKRISEANKKSYLFVVGKINPAKLANFQEIDLFVLVSCYDNALIDSKDFFKPVITPFELEIALARGKEWTGKYSTDFSHILLSSPEGEGEGEEEKEEEEYRISFTSGGGTKVMKNPKFVSKEKEEEEGKGAVVTANGNRTLSLQTPGAHFLVQRSYQGLDPTFAADQISSLVIGASGLPMAYDYESKPK